MTSEHVHHTSARPLCAPCGFHRMVRRRCSTTNRCSTTDHSAGVHPEKSLKKAKSMAIEQLRQKDERSQIEGVHRTWSLNHMKRSKALAESVLVARHLHATSYSAAWKWHAMGCKCLFWKLQRHSVRFPKSTAVVPPAVCFAVIAVRSFKSTHGRQNKEGKKKPFFSLQWANYFCLCRNCWSDLLNW